MSRAQTLQKKKKKGVRWGLKSSQATFGTHSTVSCTPFFVCLKDLTTALMKNKGQIKQLGWEVWSMIYFWRQTPPTLLSMCLNNRQNGCATLGTPLAILKKIEQSSPPMSRALHNWDACVAAPTPSSDVDLCVHSSPPKSRRNRLPLSCRCALLPAACTMVSYSCLLWASYKGLAAKGRTSALWPYTKACWQLILCVAETYSCVRVRVFVCVRSPFPQIQLCTGSWPHCPTVHRQHCEGWLHSSPGSLLPV